LAAYRHVPHLDRIGAPLRALPTLLLLATIVPSGGEAQQDSLGPKSRYNLFHRTPVELRRPMSTDRPDRTESPYTVDAGLFQAEIDLFAYRSDAPTRASRSSGATCRGAANQHEGGPDPQHRPPAGAPDLGLERGNGRRLTRAARLGASPRMKVNVGNDGGRTAFALMPFVAFVSDRGNLAAS
jgi:hypothetical protein